MLKIKPHTFAHEVSIAHGLSIVGLFLVLACSLAENVSAAHWAACGNEKETKTCEIPTGDDVIVRYGLDQRYFFVGLYGKPYVFCSNWNGDPNYTAHKKCSYALNPYASSAEWESCARLGETCEISDQPTWIRFGGGNQWVQLIHSGPFPCLFEEVGYPFADLPMPLSCEKGGPVYTEDNFPEGKPKWIHCATEDQECRVQGGQQEPVLLRYGIDSSWTYRIAMLDSIQCNNVVFNRDPAEGRRKVCQYSFMPVYAETKGNWTQVTSCTGTQCSVTYSVEQGTERSETEITTQEWSETVTVSMESGFTIGNFGASVTQEYASGYARSDTFQTALSQSLHKTSTVACGEVGQGVTAQIYQFVTHTDQACLLDASCVGSTRTADFLCVVDPPSGYKGPQCLPGYCKDELCTECSY